MPRVSVIIPAYNAAGVIAQALDSVIAQTYSDWEVIVGDDASTDATEALVSAYHPRVAYARNQHNMGIGGARNVALRQASGELIALLDADDIWLPEYLEKQIARYDAAVARGEHVGIVCCDAYELGPEGRRARTYSERAGWIDQVSLTTLLRRNTIFVSAIAPRALVQQLGNFATNCLGTEDYDMWLRIAETGRTVIAAREPLALYRIASETVSADATVMSRAAQTTYRHALARGHLNVRQRMIARRQLRMQQAVEQWESIARARRTSASTSWRALALALPLGARVVLERPERWVSWLRHGRSSR